LTAESPCGQHQQFVDTAGNAYLEGTGWLIWVVGRKPDPIPHPHPGRTSTPTGLKVLFVLLRDPTLATRPYREIAVAAGVALGAIPAVAADLRTKLESRRPGGVATVGRVINFG